MHAVGEKHLLRKLVAQGVDGEGRSLPYDCRLALMTRYDISRDPCSLMKSPMLNIRHKTFSNLKDKYIRTWQSCHTNAVPAQPSMQRFLNTSWVAFQR